MVLDPHPLYGPSLDTVTSGWASAKPNVTRFHYFDSQGSALCNYGKPAGRLFQWRRPKYSAETPPSACSACHLAYGKLPASQKPQS